MSGWLVVGAAGLLGHDLIEVLAESGEEAMGVGRPEMDVVDEESVGDVMGSSRPDVVVNAAAFTAVDEAESDEARAMSVNGDGPARLAAACAHFGSKLVHISTNYVFDGEADVPYREQDRPNPRSAYGRTKLAGERAVLTSAAESYVVRTAWLYGVHGLSFVKRMIKLEQECGVVAVVDDQWGQPTWSRDLARQIVGLIRSGAPPGMYHGTNSDRTTWFGCARETFRLLGADPQRVRPATTADFPRPAPRPAFSVLGHDRWAEAGLPDMRSWRDALADAVPLLKAQVADDFSR